MTSRRTVGLLGAVAGGAGLAAEHAVVRRARRRPDPDAAAGRTRPATRVRQVTANDGVSLHVEETGPAAGVTVVLVHGYANDLRIWHHQQRDLAARARVVCYDQRGHGRSGRPDPRSCTIDQLGRDLATVLAATAPTGPVVLVGHSMGGMALLALADREPDLFGGRVVGVALVSTSAGRLADVSFGLPLRLGRLGHRLLPVIAHQVQRFPAAVERGRRATADLSFLLTRHYGFGEVSRVSPAHVALVEQMNAGTPAAIIAAFYATFVAHDKLAALPALAAIETLVLVGDRDLMTPPEHSREIAARLPGARLVIVPDAGHMVVLERGPLVSAQLGALVDAAVAEVA